MEIVAHGDELQAQLREAVTAVSYTHLYLDSGDVNDQEKNLNDLIPKLNESLGPVSYTHLMEVPCCGGLEQAAITALKNSGKFLPWQVVTLSTDGRILD